MKSAARSRIRTWASRALLLLLLTGALFYTACIGRPQSYETPLSPAAPTAFADPSADRPIRIACYNAWILPVFSDDLDERMERIPAALAAGRPDILFLQEVWSDDARERISEAFGPSYVTARCDGGGLMLLSRFPIRSERFTPFPFDWGLSVAEWFGKKGVMEAVLETPVGAVRVANAHLALQFGEGNGRTRQLLFLRDLLDDRRDLPLIVGCDLNTGACRPGDAELGTDYLGLLEAGLVDLSPPVPTANGYDPGPPTRLGWPRGRGRRGWKPDYLFVRDGPGGRFTVKSFRVTLDTPETALSDHNLLIGEVVVERP